MVMKSIKETVFDFFEKSRESRYNLTKLSEALRKIYDDYNDDSKEEFVECFQFYVECMLQVASRESPNERCMQFISRFAALFANVYDEDQDETEEDSLYHFLLTFIIKPEYHSHSDKTIRFRVCQLIQLLLAAVPRDAAMDADLMDNVAKAMLDRVQDKLPGVRCQAAKALSRLQQPTVQTCPIIAAYILRMSCDDSSIVRATVLSCISLTTKTLPEVLDRTRDVSESVRKTAFQVLSQKVSIKALTSSQRLYLIKQGLLDQSQTVRQVVKSSLFQAWLLTYQADLVDLLKKLDVVGAYETSSRFLMAVFEATKLQDLFDGFTLLNDKKLIEFDKLTPETALYWYQLCEHFRKNSDGDGYLLERFLPSVIDLCDYMEKFFEGYLEPFMNRFDSNSQSSLSQSEEDDKIEKEFVAEQLIKIVMRMDLSDNTGRKKMIDFLKGIVLKIDVLCFPCLITPVAEYLIELHSLAPDREEDERVRLVASLIATIREPTSQPASQEVPSCLSERDVTQKKVEIAKLNVELNEAKEALHECVASKTFDKAANIQQQIDEIVRKKAAIEEAITNPTIQEPQSQELVEKTDVGTVVKCLKLFTALMSSLFLLRCKSGRSKGHSKGLHPTVLSLLDTLVIPCVLNNDVRKEAISALGISCLFSKDLASQHFLLFLQVAQVDSYVVRVAAIDTMNDIVRRFGIKGLVSNLNKDDEMEDDASEVSEDEEDIGATLMAKIMEMLDDEEDEVRQASVCFLSRVLVSHRVLSPAVVSRLILLWYNPATQDDPTSLHMISDFLNTFPYMSKEAHECVEAAILPILRVLFNAPPTSPLASVNINNVAELLVSLTSPSIIVKADLSNICEHDRKWLEEGSAHDDLAVMIASEVLSEVHSPYVNTLCKILPMLELNVQQSTNLKDIIVLCENMLKEVKDRPALKNIKKFHSQVQTLAKCIIPQVKVDKDSKENEGFPQAAPPNEQISLSQRRTPRTKSKNLRTFTSPFKTPRQVTPHIVTPRRNLTSEMNSYQ